MLAFLIFPKKLIIGIHPFLSWLHSFFVRDTKNRNSLATKLLFPLKPTLNSVLFELRLSKPGVKLGFFL